MATELNERGQNSLSEIWIQEFGLVDPEPFDLAKKNYRGRIYRLTADSIRTIAETVGFNARFESPQVRTAYLDIFKTEGQIFVEITRNTKPSEIGLRYAADRWTSSERSPLQRLAQQPDVLRPWLLTKYLAKFLPDKVLSTLAETLKIKSDERDLFYIRINFKDMTAGFIVEDKWSEKFPAGAFSVFSLGEALVPAIAATSYGEEIPEIQNPETVKTDPTKIEETKNKPTQVMDNDMQTTKYATYSKSEIDQLLKQQVDSVTTSLSSKIASQQKTIQETLKSQEREISKKVDELHTYCDDTFRKLEKTVATKESALQKIVEQGKATLASEVDQFKTYLNKSVTPNLKTIDDRISGHINDIVSSSKETEPPNNKLLYIVSFAAFILAITCLALILLKH